MSVTLKAEAPLALVLATLRYAMEAHFNGAKDDCDVAYAKAAREVQARFHRVSEAGSASFSAGTKSTVFGSKSSKVPVSGDSVDYCLSWAIAASAIQNKLGGKVIPGQGLTSWWDSLAIVEQPA